MAFEGYLDRASTTEVAGWIFDNSAPNQPLKIEVLDGEKVIASLAADTFRADLIAVGKGDGRHGFSFTAISPASAPLAARVAGKRWRIPLSGGAKKHVQLPMRFDDGLLHSIEYGLPSALMQQGFSAIPSPTAHDTEIAKRLMRAYAKTVSDHPDTKARKDDVWLGLEDAYHQEILTLLKNDDATGLMKYLRDAHNKGLTHGITQGEHTTTQLRLSADARRLVMLTVLDHLTSLAEYLGLLDVESPEQHGQWGENFHADPDAVIDRISAHIGIPVVPSQVVGSAFGLRTRRGILTTRDVLALYAALRLKTLAASGSVCEIGGGLGGVAYYANCLMIPRYTIVDLPLVSLLQGYFLLSALPNTKIALYGEESLEAAICLLPTYAFAGKFDLLFNQDSIPEMHKDYSTAYLRKARELQISQFLSINQEARAMQNATDRQTAVREIVQEAGGYECQYRFRHWIKAGYVEELYRFTP